MADASEGRAPADAVAAADAAARDAQAAERAAEAAERAADPVFAAEQEHLSATYAKLLELGRAAARAMAELAADAAADKESMAEELATNYATWDDAMETHADFMALNRIIDGYNLSHGVQAERLAAVETLLRQPYFAKVSLRFRAGDAPKDLYLGTAGISDESYRRMVVDWRSPVAEVYYNQDLGPTSYEADGRTIKVDLLLRRQFDIEADRLNGYFDSDVAIQDSLLLASLARQRSAQMQAITATIQKEQNVVIRHEDVPALLVTGIAGSGKTSVLLQRIAYLFYRNRDTLRPEDVYLLTPNPLFRSYISGVLPDLGERNPHTLTWDEFLAPLLPEGRGVGDGAATLDDLARIDAAVAGMEFEPRDFLPVACGGVVLLGADAAWKACQKFRTAPAGPHRVSLMREELGRRLEARLAQMAATDGVQAEVAALPIEEQLRLFGETVDPVDEAEERALALRYLRDRHAGAFDVVERDEWLDVDHLALRLLGEAGLASVPWAYLKMAVTGLSEPGARYVFVDEVQDYSAGQLAVMARYFRRARFLLLGDPNQAITEGTAGLDEVRAVFERACGSVDECRLMTSYRSSPAITALFAGLLPPEVRGEVSSVLRDDVAPVVEVCADGDAHIAALARVIADARDAGGLTAVVVPWKSEAKRLARVLGDDAPPVVDGREGLPDAGVVMVPLRYAKGLEFDAVIVPDASERAFPADDLGRRRLYTTVSRATRRLTILAEGALTPLLAEAGA
ncbi:HelD family protein [Adlercreutzia faecimuris]|uniref:AAA family ATPase n=1 Tax=Adlercreutzia faecimuris TaxID=2897341 RepID=A0ABS9WIK8_9ACTN|nr:ATP-binding domain-containing protein [Adlercreutzia sp. JBNU-10]MCI2242370.1 AAA family ATPase [Adlercreutzia sp. JBNU-10]